MSSSTLTPSQIIAIGMAQSTLVGSSGTGGPSVTIPSALETTSTAVANEYAADMQILEQYLNLTNPPSGQTPTTLTQAQLAALTDPSASGSIAYALTDLINLAQNGISGPINANDPSEGNQTNYLTNDMITGLNTIIVSMQNVGINFQISPTGSGQAPVVSMNSNQLQNWFDFATLTPTISQAVSSSITAAGFATHSVQALVELDYVQTANNMLSNQLSSLQQALQVTQNALTTLQNVQDLHNSLDVAAFASFSSQFNYAQNTGATSFINAYKTAASAYFNQPIALTLKSNSPFQSSLTFSQALSNLRLSLNTEISILTSAAGNSAGAYSLLTQLKVVRSNISTYLDAGNAYQWLADGNTLTFNQNGVGTVTLNPNPNLTNVDQIQQNITNAITAGENFNDTEKNNVQNFLYVFQEFYQSASSILQNLTTDINQIAQHISQ